MVPYKEYFYVYISDRKYFIMHRKRDDYEIDQNEKYLLTKKVKHEGILLYSKQSTNTFVIDGDKLPQNNRLNLPLPSKIPSQVYYFLFVLAYLIPMIIAVIKCSS
jgi:hypothetical protein